MSTIHRRQLLQALGIGAGAFLLPSALSPKKAFAAAPSRSYVFCYFRGAWDILLSLDPRDPAVFTEARKAETKIELAWDQIPNNYPRTIIQPNGSNIPLGPVMGGIAPHYEKMCVVNGISMDTVAHEVGRRYFITGLPPRGTTAAGSAVPSRIAAQQGDLLPFPNLVMGAETYNDTGSAFASGLTVNSVADLITALTDGPGAPSGNVRARLDEHRALHPLCDPSYANRRGLLSLFQGSQLKARELVSSGLSSKFQFLSETDSEMSGLASRYGINAQRGGLASIQAQAAMAFQALKYELAQCVTVELAQNLDSHDATWADEHPDQLAAAFDALGQLVSDLESTPDPSRGGTLLDHTTIVCYSEFSRTGLLNSRGGRDHSLTGSALLLGAGVPRNKVVGRSSDVGLGPQPINPVTGEVQDGGTFLTPTLVIASLMQQAGYDTTKLRAEGLPCLMA